MEHRRDSRRPFFEAVKDLNIRYVILGNGSYLDRYLTREEYALTLIYWNASYSLWRVAADIESIPLGDLVR